MNANVDYVKVVDLLADTVKELNAPCARASPETGAADAAAEHSAAAQSGNANAPWAKVRREQYSACAADNKQADQDAARKLAEETIAFRDASVQLRAIFEALFAAQKS